MVGTGGIEPPTSSVSGKRSPTELRAFVGTRVRCIRFARDWSKSTNLPSNGAPLCQGEPAAERGILVEGDLAALGIDVLAADA